MPEKEQNKTDQTKKVKMRIAQAKRRGRSPKFKADMIEDALNLGALGFTEEELAIYWGIHPRTLSRWKKRSYKGIDELCQALERGKHLSVAKVSRRLYDEAVNGDVNAIKYYLNNRAKDKWQADKNIEVNQALGIAMQGPAGALTYKDTLARQLVDSWTPEAKRRFIIAMKEQAGELGLKLPRVRVIEAETAEPKKEGHNGQEEKGQEKEVAQPSPGQPIQEQTEAQGPTAQPGDPGVQPEAQEAVLVPERRRPEGTTETVIPEEEQKQEEPERRSRAHAVAEQEQKEAEKQEETQEIQAFSAG